MKVIAPEYIKIYKMKYAISNTICYCIQDKDDRVSTYHNTTLISAINELKSSGMNSWSSSMIEDNKELILELEIEAHIDLYQEVLKYIPEELI